MKQAYQFISFDGRNDKIFNYVSHFADFGCFCVIEGNIFYSLSGLILSVGNRKYVPNVSFWHRTLYMHVFIIVFVFCYINIAIIFRQNVQLLQNSQISTVYVYITFV